LIGRFLLCLFFDLVDQTTHRFQLARYHVDLPNALSMRMTAAWASLTVLPPHMALWTTDTFNVLWSFSLGNFGSPTLRDALVRAS
jgi:hypothetical protein